MRASTHTKARATRSLRHAVCARHSRLETGSSGTPLASASPCAAAAATRKPRERSRPATERDAVERTEPDSGLGEQLMDEREQQLGLLARRRDLARANLVAATQRDRAHAARHFDAEQLHDATAARAGAAGSANVAANASASSSSSSTGIGGRLARNSRP